VPKLASGRAALLLLSCLLLLAAAYLVATHQEFALELRKSLTGFGPASLAAALVWVIAQVACQSLRFWAVVPAGAPLGVTAAAYVFTLGDWTNLFAPARGGDALKVMLLTRTGGDRSVSVPRAIGAVLADKIVDLGALVLLCAITGTLTILRAEANTPRIENGLVLVGGIAVILAAGAMLARRRWLPNFRELWRQLMQGLSALKHPSRCLISVLFGLGAWVAESFVLRVLLTGLGYTPSPAQLVFTLVLLNVGISVPVAVANLGVYEAALAYGLNHSGVPLASAIAVATAHHVAEVLGLGLVTAVCSLRVHVLGRSAA
jgi:glycosyltransferase 2 family protein